MAGAEVKAKAEEPGGGNAPKPKPPVTEEEEGGGVDFSAFPDVRNQPSK